MTNDQGYVLEHCRRNCCKATQDWTFLYESLNQMLNDQNLPSQLAKRFPIAHYHHLPKISIAGCPNACSQPQIKDIGIIGYLTPQFTDLDCTGCQACLHACQENALSWQEGIHFDEKLCIGCGDCIRACSSGKIIPGESGWVLYLGGKLGRHPRLAQVFEEKLQTPQVIDKIREFLKGYLEHGLPLERLSHFLDRRN